MRIGPTELVVCFIFIALLAIIFVAIRASSRAVVQTLQNQGKKKCPYCSEEIQKEAIYCRFCHRDLPKEVD